MRYFRTTMSGRFLTVSILALATFVPAGCNRGTAEKDVAPAQALPPAAIPLQFNLILDGSIDAKLGIEMDLRRDGEKLTGQYFYEKTREATRSRQYISLDGQMREDGTFTLN